MTSTVTAGSEAAAAEANVVESPTDETKSTRKWPFRAFVALLILDGIGSGLMFAGILPGYVMSNQ